MTTRETPETTATSSPKVLTPEEAEKLRWELQRTCDSDCEGRCQSCPATEANTLHASHEALRREVARLTEDRERLTEAVKLILADPYGCPACDSGVLRKGGTVHWDTCGYPRAKAAVEAIDAARREDATRNEE